MGVAAFFVGVGAVAGVGAFSGVEAFFLGGAAFSELRRRSRNFPRLLLFAFGVSDAVFLCVHSNKLLLRELCNTAALGRKGQEVGILFASSLSCNLLRAIL